MKHIVNYVVHRDGLPDVIVTSDMYYADFKKRIQAMIGVVEQMCYTLEGGKDKPEWRKYTTEQFQGFRKKMLDIADEVSGLEEDMVINTFEEEEDDAEEEISSFVHGIFRKKREG